MAHQTTIVAAWGAGPASDALCRSPKVCRAHCRRQAASCSAAFAVNQHTAALPRRQRGQRKATPRAQLASPVPYLPAHVLQNTAWPHGG